MRKFRHAGDPPPEKPIVMMETIPRLKYFFGRKEEIREISEFMDSETHRILVLRGIAGIGKTALISKILKSYGKKMNILYMKIYHYSTLGGVLSRLAEFLTKLGKEKLSKYLAQTGGKVELEGLMSALEDALKESNSLLIIDDVHYASEEINKIFTPLMDVLDVTNVKFVIVGRSVPRFYDKRDILVRKSLKEVALGGLDKDSSRELLKHRGINESYYEKLYSITGGHPLMLELATPETMADAADFIEKQIIAPLNDPERKALEIASVFRAPAPPKAIMIEGVNEATVGKLASKLLLEKVNGNYEEHELLRGIFYGRLTADQKVGYHRLAAEYYVGVGTDSALIEAIYHLIKGYRQSDAARLAIERGERLIKGGYASSLLTELMSLEEAEVPDYWAYVLILKGDILSQTEKLGDAFKHYDMCVEYTESARPRGGREIFSYLWFGASRELLRARALAYLKMGQIHVKRSDRESAKEAYSQSLKIFKELEDPEAGRAEKALRELAGV